MAAQRVFNAAPSATYGQKDPRHTGLMEGRMLKAQVEDIHRSATLPEGAKVLCVALYSDSTVVTGTGGIFCACSARLMRYYYNHCDDRL